MILTSRNQDPIHASLALSSLLSVWYKPNSLNNKSIYNTLLLEFYICAKPRLTHWYPCPKKKCHYFCAGVYCNKNVCPRQYCNKNGCPRQYYNKNVCRRLYYKNNVCPSQSYNKNVCPRQSYNEDACHQQYHQYYNKNVCPSVQQ